ncbi:putative polyketide synthase [Aspergillus alliaceus]|uniref:Putative polyketide synthase n=1 Tax=Petromyces alliaceus TaxID=209559 RepID=A0A5N7BR09_PETAA|nr:putative polyketide synthase [Aspergillus alliaceus]
MAPIPNPDATQPGDSPSTNGATMNGTESPRQHAPSIPIAIVGMACRFSGNVRNPTQLWELCANGKDGWSHIPDSRFDVKSLYHPDNSKAGRSHVIGGYFLDDDIACFDAAFFNLASDVASGLDPQARLLLETVYEATEDAGIPLDKLAGTNTSVYTGTFNKDYHEIQTKDAEVLTRSFLAGTGTAMLSNRVSHFFDLQGPSLSIDTGCSSGLVAVHQACQSIRAGESNISIVGASSTLLSQDAFISASTIGAIGSEGKCFAWDNRAAGYGRGEGVAALILKPLDAALLAGDQIHAVIKGSGVNQDGKTTTITSPSADAQVNLIEQCYRRAGLDIAQTGYVEAHMTGTAAGDPVEAEAIARTFGKARQANDKVLVGSVKTNVGHTEPVSGLAAVIKTTFALKTASIPPNLNYETPNPSIDFDKGHLEVPTRLAPWPEDKILRASINNFGYGGTNAHVILEPAPAPTAIYHLNGQSTSEGSQSGDKSRVFVVSARDSAACRTVMDRLASHIIETSPSPDSLAYTLNERRSLHPWVAAVRATSIKDLAERLRESERKPSFAYKKPRLGFVFNGQGAQWHAMARELLTVYPVFGHAISNAGKVLKVYGASWSLIDELNRDETTTRVSEIHLSQPISVAIQLGLIDLLKSWGITPSAITSHSSGEIAAAYAAGALPFEQALGVAYYRGELARKQLKVSSLTGGMLAVGIDQQSAERHIAEISPTGDVVVACVNSPSSVTLSGDLDTLDEIAARFEKEGVFTRKLKVPMAYHSHHMMPMVAEYTERLEELLDLPVTPEWNGPLFVSPVTGEAVTAVKTFRAEHWVQNLTKPVQFSRAFENMCFSSSDSSASSANVDLILEIGPHSTLAGPIRQILKEKDVKMPYVSCLRRPINAVETMQDLACELLSQGYPVDLKSVNFPTGDAHHTFLANLPSYPWNHSTRFWVEPRIAKEQRFKKFPPHELLGTPLNGSNALTPTWRNFLRLSEIEWLKDHQIDDTVVFPGAGYIAMAIEAIRLITDPSESTIRKYRLRDIDIMNALVLPDSEMGVEVQLQLRRCSDRELDHEGWYQFELCSLASADAPWIEHCKGYVAVETESETRIIALNDEREFSREDAFFADGVDPCPIDIDSLFAGLRQRGIYHGPLFQNIVDSHAARNRAITNFAISDIACQEHEYVLHPTTLDSILQSSFSSLPDDIGQNSMVLPRSIRTIDVPRNFKRQGGERLRALSEMITGDTRGYSSNITVVSDNSDTTRSFLEIKEFFGSAIPRRAQDSDEEAGICSINCWELDILHNPPASFRESMVIPVKEHEIEQERKLTRMSYIFIHDAAAELEPQESESWQWHHKRLYAWMREVVALGEAGQLGPNSQSWAKLSPGAKRILADELSAGNAAGRLTVRIGEKLTSIIRGDIMPLELMMEGDLLNQFYMQHEALKTRSYSHLARVAELYAVKNPGANILEIGGGTGGATSTILEAFGKRGFDNGTILGHYTFTDISPGFFEAAREKFAPWARMMDFKKLDIEIDPLAQSFTSGSYDLIVAASVLHATKNLHTTMKHVRKLLKPGGTLLLIEATADRLEGQLIFGTLPGWWLGEEPERQKSPNAPLKMWDRVLRDTGFTGVDFEISDYEEPEFQSARVMLSRTSATVQAPISIVVEDKTAEDAREWLAELSDAIREKTGILPKLVDLSDVDSFKDTVCIVALEMGNPFVYSMDADAFQKLKNLLLLSSGILWLSCGGLVHSQNPAFSASEGLLRTMRQEDSHTRWIRLDFENDENPWTSGKIGHIVHVLERSFDKDAETGTIEWEYSVADSQLHVPRIFPEETQDAIARNLKLPLEPALEAFHQPDKPLVWETSPSTGLDPYFVENPVILSTDVPSEMVEVEARAFGLNFREVMVALGQLEEPLTGYECSGIVTRLGPNTEQSGLKVGDRVAALCKGRIASKGRTYWTSVVKVPDEMPWKMAASFPAAYTTAYGSLIQVAGLQKGESVLIHAASGATGQAAIVIAQHVGAEVFATCSTEGKRDLLVEHYGIKPDHIFASRSGSFAAGIMTETNGKGVDVILNSLSGPLLKASWDCMARFGRFVDITKVDMEANRWLQTAPFSRCSMFSSFDLLQLTEYRGRLTHSALSESLNIVRKRGISPVHPITPYPISEMATAMRQMQGGMHVGKLVLVPHDEDRIKFIRRPSPVSLDNPGETYLVVGGLGGIGRAIATWMIENGAKNLVLVSRHATSHPEAPQLVKMAETAGCRLQIHDCDISNEASLLQLIRDCSETLPPFRGVINGAMVLDDTVLERMTFEQWSNAVRPKINSSWNLHTHLPNLAFFVMLSSVAGVAGHMSQANYSAGNSFEDALARYRTARGLPAVTIDLGAVKSVGYVADREASGDDRLRARVENVGFGSVDLDHVLRMVGHGISESLRQSPSQSQVVVGPNFHTLASESVMSHDRRFGTLRIASQRGIETATTSTSKTSTAALTQALSKASTLTEAVALLVQAIMAKIAEIFNIPLSDIDAELPMSRYGVDSLVAVELRNWLSSGAKAKVTVFDILQSASLNEFGALVVSRSEDLTSRNLPA